MTNFIIPSILLFMMGVIAYLIVFLKYKKSINASKAHLERVNIFAKLLDLNAKYRDLRREGNFSDTPLMNSFVEDTLDRLTCPKDFGLDDVRFKKKGSIERDELRSEVMAGSDVELSFWRDFDIVFGRLHKANQPLSYAIFSLKKMLQMRILLIFIKVLLGVLKILKNRTYRKKIMELEESKKKEVLPWVVADA